MWYIPVRFERGPLMRLDLHLGLEALGRDRDRRVPGVFCVLSWDRLQIAAARAPDGWTPRLPEPFCTGED